MKKKATVGILLGLALAAQSTTAFGAVSPSANELTIAIKATTESGLVIRENSKGEAVIGEKTLFFAKNAAATAGLPTDIVYKIEDINNGKSLSSILTAYDLTKEKEKIGKDYLDLKDVPIVDLAGYNALTGTHALVTKSTSTGKVDDTSSEVVIYVPNLVDGLGDVSVLYYNNATGNWLLLPVSKIDIQSKLIYVTVTGSGTLSVVYKR